MALNVLKTSFAVDSKYEAFYTGGKVQVSVDGQHMFCQCGGKVQVLSVESGKLVQSIEQDGDDEVTALVVSPDDKNSQTRILNSEIGSLITYLTIQNHFISMLVVASRSLLFRMWDWMKPEVLKTWKSTTTAVVCCMAFDVTSTLLACGSADSSVMVYDVVKRYYTHRLVGHQGVISVVLFHPDISRLQLFTSANDYIICVWDLQTSSCIAQLQGHFSLVTSIQISTDGDSMYCGGRDNIISMWDIKEMKRKKMLPVYESVESLILLEEDEDLSDMNIEPGQTHVITAGSKGVLRVWNTATGRCVYTQPGIGVEQHTGEDDEVTQAILQADYCKALKTIFVVTYDHNILLYHVNNLKSQKQFAGNNDDILDVRFMGQNDSHVAVATNSELIKVFEVRTWNCQVLRGHTDIVISLDVYHNGSILITGSKDNSLRLWQMDDVTGHIRCVAVGQGHTHAVGAVAFSKLKESFMVSGGHDLTLKLWKWPTEFEDGEVISLHSHVTEKAHDKDINSLSVSPNDKLIVSGSQDKTAKLWNGSDLSLRGTFRGHKRGIWCVNFSPVDQCVATASADCTIKIWAISDFSCVKTFEGHESSVLKVHFLTRGMQLLSSGSDGLMKMWTIKTNVCVKTFDEHSDKVWALAVNKTEDLAITGAGDSSIILWKDVTGLELDEEREKQETLILREQQLANLIHQKKYLKAIALAITMDQPFKVLSLMKDILGDPDGKESLEETLTKLREDQIDAILRFCSTWNTNSKHCHVAQFVLSVILKTYSPEELFKFTHIKSSLEGLLPYTDRHFKRMSRLLQQSTFVDYTWQCMRVVGTEDVTSEREQNRTNRSDTIYEIDKGKLREPETEETSSSDEEPMESDDTSTWPESVPSLSKTTTPNQRSRKQEALDKMARSPTRVPAIKVETDSSSESRSDTSESENEDEMSIKDTIRKQTMLGEKCPVQSSPDATRQKREKRKTRKNSGSLEKKKLNGQQERSSNEVDITDLKPDLNAITPKKVIGKRKKHVVHTEPLKRTRSLVGSSKSSRRKSGV